jgi:hypothetical protein
VDEHGRQDLDIKAPSPQIGKLLSHLGIDGVVFRRKGHMPQAVSGRGEDRVAHRRRDANDACLSRTRRRQIFAIEEDDVDLRSVAEARNAVLGKPRILYSAVGEQDSLEERASDALNERTLHLVAKPIGIYDRAAFPCLHGATDLDFPR